MMALFIVLWLLSASEKVQKAVGGYFQDPTGKGRQTGTTSSGAGETLTLNRHDLEHLKEKVEEMLKQIPALQHMEKQIRITLTTEGLRIDLLETERGLFFETGNPKPTEAGSETLAGSRGGVGEASQQSGHRRTYRRHAVRTRGLLELGTIGRSRQRGSTDSDGIRFD